ncbi:NUDIX domain-containing protein [Streptomyces sp. NPDC127106]|uniref:NUDIX domain-containing protein n=1 Tax=Streptomyces sp. NPDC127106 TaxID=3345360 RepID=UPI00363F8B3B
MKSSPTAQDWDDHYDSGRGFRPLSGTEKDILRERLLPRRPRPDGARGARALDVACGTGELARFLASAGYRVDAVDFAAAAIRRARDASPPGIAYHCLDVVNGDLAALAEPGGPAPRHGPDSGPGPGFDVITVRRALAHLPDRTRVTAALGRLLRPDGTLCVITPHADRQPARLRGICLDDAEIGMLTDGWEHAERTEADGSTVLLLRGPGARTVGYREKLPPGPAALAGVAVVVTNAHGQVLLGWNPARGVWELPAGKVEPGEAFEATAVRELEEEAGLRASADRVVLLGTLCDSAHGLARVTEVARLTGYAGEPIVREREPFSRWEWHTPADLRGLPQPLFTSTAQALNVVWPGLLPGVPGAHHTPRPAGSAVLRFGEPPAAARLRALLVAGLVEEGWADIPELREAFARVPRHAFLPEQPLERAYANGAAADGAAASGAVATVGVEEPGDPGRRTGPVSRPEMLAVMLRRADLRPGHRVLEVGGGGYDACLIAELVGESGSVVSVETDPSVHARTVRFLEETWYADRVRPVLGDGAHGVPAPVLPPGGFDAIVVTAAADDVPSAWRDQLAEGGRLVLPLRLGGRTRAIGFTKRRGVLFAAAVGPCGFVPVQGVGRRDESPVPIGRTGYGIRWEDTPPLPLDGIERALAGGEAVEQWTGVTVRDDESLEVLQLWLATTLPGFCRLTGDHERPGILRLPEGQGAAAVATAGALACLVQRRVTPDTSSGVSRREFGVQAVGPDGKAAGDAMAAAVLAWDRELRGHGAAAPAAAPLPVLTPVLTLALHPAGTPDGRLPAGHVVDKPRCRIVCRWQPARTGGPEEVGP